MWAPRPHCGKGLRRPRWGAAPHPGKGHFALCNPKLKTRARQIFAVARVFDCYASVKLLRGSVILTYV